jgi:hypothetical protein
VGLIDDDEVVLDARQAIAKSGLTRERQRRDDQRLACPELLVPANELRVSLDRHQRKTLSQFVHPLSNE